MPIQSIIDQPLASSLHAAYRPVVFTVRATSTQDTPQPPVVYCDIYFGGIFYKTLSKTMYKLTTIGYSEYEFDIQDAAQEYLKKFLASNGGTVLSEASPIMTKAICKFRSSGFDTRGFLKAEGTAPVQATGSQPAVNGTGTQSNELYIVNATLQHQDNQELSTHLASYRKRTWNANSYPLTHRPDHYFITKNDSDYFPALVPSNVCLNYLKLNYRFYGQSTWRIMQRTLPQECSAVITSITSEQLKGTTNRKVQWTASNNPTSYYYRIDGGTWLPTTATEITFNSFSIAEHTFDIFPLCQCGQGTVYSHPFIIEDPVTFVCTSEITVLEVSQVGNGTVSADWAANEDPDYYRYRIDGGAWVESEGGPIGLEGIPVGDHTFEVEPVCGNGVSGTSATAEFTVIAIPTLIRINETATGPGGIRTQYFEVGSSVSPGNKYRMTVYNVTTIVTAVTGDTPATIATKLADAINAKIHSQWNVAGAAPAMGTPGYPPYAVAAGNRLTVQLNYSNSFTYIATIN